MIRMRKLVLVLLALVLAATVYARSLTCSIDHTALYFTGKTRVEMGTMLYLYKCSVGHGYWLTDDQRR